MYIFSFASGALYFGWPSCIYMGCTDIGYCIYDIYGLWTVFVVRVYGLVFMAMCLWICVYGYVYGHRVLILRKAWFDKHQDLLLHEARLNKTWVLFFHKAHFSNCWDLLPHEAHLSNSWVLLLHEAHFYHYWVLLTHETHFYHYRVLLTHEAQLDDSSNFSNFPPKKRKNFAPVCNAK
jgi:hypothetical protein